MAVSVPAAASPSRPGLDDVAVVADKELVVMRVELLKQELEERRRLLALHVPVRRGIGVVVDA